MWHKVKLILEQQGQNLENLSPNLLENNDSLLPHLIEQIGVSNVKKMLTGLGVELFAESQVGNNNKALVSAGNNTKDLAYAGNNNKDNKALIKFLIYVNRFFVIVNTHKDNKIDNNNKDNQIDSDNKINDNQINTKAFSINPFSSLACFEIRSKATELGLKIKKIGFIAPEHAVFKAQQQGKHNTKNNTKGNTPEGESIDTLLNVILDKAVKNKVSDVHIAPRNDTNIAIHFRQFGEVVESGVADINISEYQTFANLLIVAAGGNAGVYARFVEKQFDYKNESEKVNISVRFQQNPSVQRFSNKEIVPSFVLRIHDKNRVSSFKSLHEIELLPEHKQILSRAVKHNSGLIIVSGPTGAGKTTMLYAKH
jgi:type II secretory ATPase GspE/PulE/Tfp pilus assembly ATPase PilB-like protein